MLTEQGLTRVSHVGAFCAGLIVALVSGHFLCVGLWVFGWIYGMQWQQAKDKWKVKN